MQNKLQELTEKIYKEGLEKGNEEAAQIVAKAREEASRILAEAKSQAEAIVSRAKKESEDYRKNVDTEINLSARQVVTGLKQEITRMIEAKLFEAPVTDAVKDAELLKKVIETAISRWEPNSPEAVSLKVLLPAELEKQLGTHFAQKVADMLNKGIEVQVDKAIKYGFRIGPKDGSYFISFTEKDFDNLFRDYMRPKIVEMLFGGK